jgi:uncharacterized protein (TIGR00730 family)
MFFAFRSLGFMPRLLYDCGMHVYVSCSANNLAEMHTEPAKVLARLLAKNNHTMLYGGSDYGLMKVLADTIQQAGGKVVGITIPFYASDSRKNIELVVAKTLSERKTMLLERSDAIVVLAGGLGTLDELTEILELKKQDHHNKPVIILNTHGFYDGLKLQLQRMADERLLKVGERVDEPSKRLNHFVEFVATPQDVMALLASATKKN